MITVIPSLDFMRSLCGTYKAAEGSAELRIWSCGYGIAMDLRGERKTEIMGVIGAFNNVVECFAQIGLPNVIRLVGQKMSDASIQFTGDDLPIVMILMRESGTIRVTFSLNGKERLSHVLRAA